MLSTTECQSGKLLDRLGHEDLREDELSWFESHLQTCPTCRDLLDRPDADASFRRWAHQLEDLKTESPDPTLQELLEQLQEGIIDIDHPGPVELYFLQPSDRDDLLGTLSHYEIHEIIGQGGIGVVLRAFEPSLQRWVALKVMSPTLAGSRHAVQRFIREARSSAAVCHKNVIVVHSVDEVQGLPYLVMEHVAGDSLQERLDRSGPLPVTEVVRIGQEIAAGLAAAHAQGVIHRDIKPANILLEEKTGAVKITDFGLARSVDDVNLTQHGVVIGTPEYMAPEQARGEQVDHRADLFALGSVLYAMCTGASPFRGRTTLGVLRSLTDDTPPPIHEIDPNLPLWLSSCVALLLTKDRKARPWTSAEVAELLGQYLNTTALR